MSPGECSDRERVLDFLRRFKSRARDEGMVFVRRAENVDTLIYLGMLTYMAEECIMGITDMDYISGPLHDHDRSPGEVWEFAIPVQDVMVYIKLKLDEECAKCISFHPPRDPLTFPFK